MLEYLENLRKKPEAERRKSVFVISFSLTFIIALIWLGSLFVQNKVKTSTLNMEVVSRTMPSIKDTFTGFFDTIKNIFNNSMSAESEKADAMLLEEQENYMPVYEPEVIDDSSLFASSTEVLIIEPETTVSPDTTQ